MPSLIPTLDNSICNTEQGSETAKLLKKSELIIWDETPMAHKYCFEALDRSLRDIMKEHYSEQLVFGGKVIGFSGDFRQILHVILGGTRSDIVHATINSSYLWDHCQVLRLTKSMRMLQKGLQTSTATEIQQFSQWIVNLGYGLLGEPNDGLVEIDIPKELLISDTDPIQANRIDDISIPNDKLQQ